MIPEGFRKERALMGGSRSFSVLPQIQKNRKSSVLPARAALMGGSSSFLVLPQSQENRKSSVLPVPGSPRGR